MKLSYIGMSSGSTGSQVRTAALWNIAVSIDRLREQLEFSEAEPQKSTYAFADELVQGRSYEFSMRSGAKHTGEFRIIRGGWIVIRCGASGRALLAVDAVEAIVQQNDDIA